MSDAITMDLKEVIDEQRRTRSTLWLYLVAIMVMVTDGFDVAVIGYLAPELVKEWGVEPARLVPAFSLGIIGAMVGGLVMGLLGDRFGRKRTLIVGMSVMGIGTLATLLVRSSTELMIVRLLTGLGIGGVMPNALALVAENTPQRIRGRLIIIVTLGILPGIALAGLAAATLIPLFGWRALMLVGGIIPIVVAIAAYYLSPESIEYLVRRGGRDEQVRALARRMRPDLEITQATTFAMSTQAGMGSGGSPSALFAGALRIVTPLLWICVAVGQMANYFALTWLPTLLQSTGWTTSEAGFLASAFSIGGLVGGLLLLFIIDRRGIVALVLLFLAGTPLFAMMLAAQVPQWATALIIASAGLCIGGINFGTGALPAILYPGAARSMGVGGVYSSGRVGALAAPLVGGLLLDMHLPAQEVMLVPAALIGGGALCCIALALICLRRFGSFKLREITSAPEQASPDLARI